MILQYPATFTPVPEGCIVVTFRDVDGAIVEARDMLEARQEAAAVLESLIDLLIEKDQPLPVSSPIQEGEEMVELSEQILLQLQEKHRRHH